MGSKKYLDFFAACSLIYSVQRPTLISFLLVLANSESRFQWARAWLCGSEPLVEYWTQIQDRGCGHSKVSGYILAGQGHRLTCDGLQITDRSHSSDHQAYRWAGGWLCCARCAWKKICTCLLQIRWRCLRSSGSDPSPPWPVLGRRRRVLPFQRQQHIWTSNHLTVSSANAW